MEISTSDLNINTLVNLLDIKRQNCKIADFFPEKCTNIAIYGCGVLGQQLYKELEKTDIRVKYFIDKNDKNDFYVVKPNEEWSCVDAFVICVNNDLTEISNSIYSKMPNTMVYTF